MATEIGDRGAAHRSVEAPVEGNRGVDELVRKPGGAEQPDLADSALADHPPHQGHGRQAAVVEANGVENPGFAGGVNRGGSLRVGDGKRLLADHRLAGRCRRDRDLGVSPRRSADVNDVDLGPAHQLAPVGDRAIHTVRDGCRIDVLLVAPADQAKPRAVAEPPHHRGDGVAVRVRFAHDSVADDPDPHITAHHDPAIWAAARSAAPSAAAASCASAPWRGSPRTWRAEPSACWRRAPENVSSAPGGPTDFPSSPSFGPHTPTLPTPPRGERPPPATTDAVPPPSPPR